MFHMHMDMADLNNMVINLGIVLVIVVLRLFIKNKWKARFWGMKYSNMSTLVPIDSNNVTYKYIFFKS